MLGTMTASFVRRLAVASLLYLASSKDAGGTAMADDGPGRGAGGTHQQQTGQTGGQQKTPGKLRSLGEVALSERRYEEAARYYQQAIDLERPFTVGLTRSPGEELGEASVAVRLSQRDIDGTHRTLSFKVGVEENGLLSEVEVLEVAAPFIHPDDFQGWVWPLVESRARIHGAALPIGFEAEAGGGQAAQISTLHASVERR